MSEGAESVSCGSLSMSEGAESVSCGSFSMSEGASVSGDFTSLFSAGGRVSSAFADGEELLSLGSVLPSGSDGTSMSLFIIIVPVTVTVSGYNGAFVLKVWINVAPVSCAAFTMLS